MSKRASAILIETHEGFLCVSRPGGMWGMPGGKIEEGETSVQTAIRELKEETGILVEEHQLVLVYSGYCEEYFVFVYKLTGVYPELYEVVTEPGIYADFLCEEELSSPLMSPFWEFNKKMLEAVSCA